MKLSFLERTIINSPIRGLSLRFLEPEVFAGMATFPKHAHVLDLGCGNGTGLIWAAQTHAPASLTGVDVDATQLARAANALQALGISAHLIEASAEKIPLPAHSQDVILSSGCLHHVENWRTAVHEAARLLTHGGLLFALEFYRPLLRILGLLFRHPKNRFTHAEFTQQLTTSGFNIVAEKNILGLFGFTVARRIGSSDHYD